jgi:hypothetical protein
MTMDQRWILFDVVGVGSYLSSDVVKVKFAEILRGWTQHRRPAIFLSIDAETPAATVHGEDELRAAFKGTPIVDVESIGRNTPGSLLVFASDGRETIGYRIADPRGMNFPSRWHWLATRPTKRQRGV